MVGLTECEWIDEDGEKCGKKIPEVPKHTKRKYGGQELCEEHRKKYLEENDMMEE